MKDFTKEELATLLNNREYRHEVPDDLGRIAAENKLVIVFGASDDLCEFRGAINDEVDIGMGTIPIEKDGVLRNECDERNCPYFAKLIKRASRIEAVWGEACIDWTYKTDIPHTTFDIYEDGEVYCRGIVFSLEDVG